MNTWVISGIVGVFAGIGFLLLMRQAKRDAITVERQKDLISGNLQTEQDEDAIEEAAAKARRDALPDFTTLR